MRKNLKFGEILLISSIKHMMNKDVSSNKNIKKFGYKNWKLKFKIRIKIIFKKKLYHHYKGLRPHEF